jgi:glycosyltransferase involved in cell wall biosynthesis
MKYLVVSDRFFGDAPGGSYRIAWELAKEMKARGHEVTLLCGSLSEDPPAGSVLADGVTVARYRIPEKSNWAPGRWHYLVEAARLGALKELGATSWDVIHVHSPASGMGAIKAYGKGARIVVTIHSPIVLEQQVNWRDGTVWGFLKSALGLPMLARAERHLLREAHRVHVLSRYTLQELVRLHGKEISTKTSTIPWWGAGGAPLDRASARDALGWPQEATIVFTVRRLVKRMGLHGLVEAASRVPKDVPLLVAIGGEGPEREALCAQINKLGLKAKVWLLGRISEADLSRSYAACDAFVLPTLELECFGIIAVDALSYGRPVIGSNAGAIPEIISDILPDWLFPPGNVDALEAKLVEFLRGELTAPSEAALSAFAQERYGKRRLLDEYAALLFR